MPDPTRPSAVVLASAPVLTRYVAGFTDETRTRQTPDLPNHVAWTLGHCAYTMGRLVERFGGPDLPAADFIDNAGRGAGPDRYDFQLLRLGSTPIDDVSLYPRLVRCVAIFEAAAERLASTEQAAARSDLDASVDWGGTPRTLGELVIRVSLHNATHAGQLADLRRALGMPRVFA
jgi:hypothetical protein